MPERQRAIRTLARLIAWSLARSCSNTFAILSREGRASKRLVLRSLIREYANTKGDAEKRRPLCLPRHFSAVSTYALVDARDEMPGNFSEA